MAAKKRVRRPNSVKGAAVVKVPQAHGGALLSGGLPGNRGNPTPCASPMIRAALRLAYDDRRAFLEKVIDGDVVQRSRVSLLDVLQFAHCPTCGDALKANAGIEIPDALTITLEAMVSPQVRERIMAMEHLAKYGLGALKEVDREAVREKVQETLNVIRRVAPEQAPAIIAELRPVWQAA